MVTTGVFFSLPTWGADFAEIWGQVKCGQCAVLYLLQADLGQNLRLCFYICGWSGYFEFGDAGLGDQLCIDGGKYDK